MKGIIFTILALTSISSFSSFDIKVFENGPRLLRFNNYEKLEAFYNGENSITDFTRATLQDFDSHLKTLFGCESLVNNRVVTDCLEDLKQVPFFAINYPNFSYVTDKRLSGFGDEFYKAIHKKIEDIHPRLRELLLGKLSSYEISNNTFYTEKNETDLIRVLTALKDFPVNNIDPQGYCDMRSTQNTHDLYLGGFEPSETYDEKECKRLGEGIFGWALGLVRDNNQSYTFEIYHPKLREIVETHLNAELAQRIYALELTSFYMKGTVVNNLLRSIMYQSKDYTNLMATRDFSIKDNLKYISSTSPIGNVAYEGVSGLHYFMNDNFKLNIVNLTETLSRFHNESRNYFAKNAEEGSIFVDTNTEQENSRLEPIDLVSNLMYKKLLRSYSVENPSANFKNYLKEIIKFMTMQSDDVANPIYIYPRNPVQSSPKFICAYPSFDNDDEIIKDFSFLSLIPSYKSEGENPDDEDNSGDVNEVQFESEKDEHFVCADKNFRLEKKRRLEAPLDLPNDIKVKDGYIDILMPYSLTMELNEQFKRIAKTYFKALRYSLEIEELESVKDFVSKQISNIDVLMPAGHGLASRDLSLGSKKGSLWTFTRERRSGELYGVRFKFILPKQDLTFESIGLEELADAYTKRMDTTSNPLFVFVISCNSENNLSEWSFIYRRAIEMKGGDNGMLPYVMASSRGFPTSSNVEIASSIFYPSDVADMLARGSSAKDVYEDLKVRRYGSIAKELFKRIGRAWLPIKKSYTEKGNTLGDIFKKPEHDSFSPVYNLSEDYIEMILKMTGMQFKLYQEGQIIMDETY